MSDHATMDARDRFRTLHREPVAEMTFAEWTERVCWQPELVTARELAGLSDERLTAMAHEFESSPRRRRTDPGRFAFPLATLTIAAGALAAMAEMQLRAAEGAGLLAPGLVAIACFIVGFLAICLGVVSRFRLVPLEQAHASLGLLVGVLDERHPWLYRAYLLDRNPAARDYRQDTLRERGPLRGMDFVMMQEVASIQERMEMTQTARSVAAALQSLQLAEVRRIPAGPAAASPALAPLTITQRDAPGAPSHDNLGALPGVGSSGAAEPA